MDVDAILLRKGYESEAVQQRGQANYFGEATPSYVH